MPKTSSKIKAYILVDTTQQGKHIIFVFNMHTKMDRHVFSYTSRFSDKLTDHIMKALEKSGVRASDLSGIGVITGPGSFSAVRYGVATANAFAYGLNLPIVGIKQVSSLSSKESYGDALMKALKGKKKFVPVKPYYDREPNIG